MTTLILTASAVFVIGFLLGDRRGIKQATAILDEHCRDMIKAIGEEPPPRRNLDNDEDRPATPTVH